ncbi:MAG: hypothetical protein ABR936_16750 [Bacteroidota bacterium]|jgi:hypothetical protein
MDEKIQQSDPPSHGVFLTKGMRIGIPPGGFQLRIGEDGKPNASLNFHVSIDVTNLWFDLAIDHLESALLSRQNLNSAWKNQANEEIECALQAESLSCMQATMASAVAIDAFYSAVKDRITIPSSTLDAWQKKRTARYVQVFEVLRRGFRIVKCDLPTIRQILKDLYRFRDVAVHPDAKLTMPIPHPTLKVSTEWRFVYFRVENAEALVRTSLGLVVQLLTIPSKKYKELNSYCAERHEAFQTIVTKWEKNHGKLYLRKDQDNKLTAQSS